MKPIDRDLILSRLRYDAGAGNFYWAVDNRGNRRAGDLAGSATRQGYWKIKINQTAYMAHRLAWVITHGDIPAGFEIDHIDGNPLNNRIENLRLASRPENCRNIKGEGVRWEESRGKWLARVGYDYQTINLGRYDTKEEAIAAVRAAKTILFGDFTRAA